MGRAQHHARRLPGLECLLPAGSAQAPAVACLQSGKPIIRHRRRKIVAARFGEFQELVRHHRTNGMAADFLFGSIAAAVAEESGHRLDRTFLKLAAEDVARLGWTTSPAAEFLAHANPVKEQMASGSIPLAVSPLTIR